MPLKIPRNPNPNIALINRRQTLGSLGAFGSADVGNQASHRRGPPAEAGSGNNATPSLNPTTVSEILAEME